MALNVLEKPFRVAYFAPASGLNPDTQKLYSANKLTITRQLKYSNKNKNSIDTVFKYQWDSYCYNRTKKSNDWSNLENMLFISIKMIETQERQFFNLKKEHWFILLWIQMKFI